MDGLHVLGHAGSGSERDLAQLAFGHHRLAPPALAHVDGHRVLLAAPLHEQLDDVVRILKRIGSEKRPGVFE